MAILGLVASIGLLNWSGQLWTFKALLIVATVFFGNLSWTLANEYYDIDVDRVNKPWKPLPSGDVSKHRVYLLSYISIWISLFANTALAIFFDWMYLLGFLGHLTSGVYNMFRKDLFGNVCMATTYGTGAFLSLYPHQLLFCLPFALFTLAHNLNNQYQDFKAEQTAGVVTVPQQLGKLKTYYFAEFLLLTALVLLVRMFNETSYNPLLLFMAVTITTMISTSSMLTEQKKAHWIIENVARRLGRFLLLVGFLTMLLP